MVLWCIIVQSLSVYWWDNPTVITLFIIYIICDFYCCNSIAAIYGNICTYKRISFALVTIYFTYVNEFKVKKICISSRIFVCKQEVRRLSPNFVTMWPRACRLFFPACQLSMLKCCFSFKTNQRVRFIVKLSWQLLSIEFMNKAAIADLVVMNLFGNKM